MLRNVNTWKFIAVKNEHQLSCNMIINGNEIKLGVVNMGKDLSITFEKRLEYDYHKPKYNTIKAMHPHAPATS